MSIRTNYLYNLLGMLSGILFPLITFPYSARVIGVDGIGQVRFFHSIITYVVLFSSLGIPIYGIREIAKVRDDKVKVANTTVEILLLHLVLTFLGYLVIAIICSVTPKISEDIPLFLILSASLFFNSIGCEWYFAGNEDFKYITIRAFFVRIISVILLFAFVHSKADLLEYAVVTVIGTVGNNLFNFIRLGHLISFSEVRWGQLRIFSHLYPSLKVFILYAIISFYTNMNAVVLGFFQDNEAVGYFEAATKITSILIAIVGALQTVMIPRFSYLVEQGSREDFNILCQKVVDFVVMISIPSAIISAILAPSIIRVLCGEAYEPAILMLLIISPMIFFVSLSRVPCFQILYPQGREKEAIWSVATGGLVNLFLCALFVPFWSYYGAAVALVACEAVVFVTMFLFGNAYIPVKVWSSHYLNCLIAGSVVAIVLLALVSLRMSDWMSIIVSSFIGIVSFFMMLLFMKDEPAVKLKKDSRAIISNLCKW